AGATPRRDHRRQRGGPLRAAVRADALRLRRRPPRLGGLPVLRRLVHQAPAPPLLPFADMSTHASKGRRLPSMPRPRLPRRNREILTEEEIVPWAIQDRIGLALAWISGFVLIAISVAIVVYMLVRGLQYVNLSAIGQHPIVGSTTVGGSSTTGGYLDP